MEEDILNYSPTVMFRGTPCIKKKNLLKEAWNRLCEQTLIKYIPCSRL